MELRQFNTRPQFRGSKVIGGAEVIEILNGFRFKTNSLPYYFYIYLADRKLREFNNMQKSQTESYRGKTIPWIEKLLETPIDDYRKTAVSLILAPYLINIKKVSYEHALDIINSWLSKCGKLRQLDQNFDYTVRYALKYSAKNGHKPIKYDTLKLKNKTLYDLLNSLSSSEDLIYIARKNERSHKIVP
jgi:hypothetical protein